MSINHFKKGLKGFSIMELILVIGLMAMLSISSFVIYPRIHAKRQAQQQNGEQGAELIRQRIRAEASGLPVPHGPTQLIVPGEGTLKPGCSNRDENCVPVYGTPH